MIPDLLQVEEKKVIDFDFESALHFIFEYDFLPTSILPSLMVKLHEHIEEGQQWRTGFVLYDDTFKSRALIKIDKEEKRLYIWVTSDEPNMNRDYFNYIRTILKRINNTYESLEVLELIPLPGHEGICVEYEDLVGHEEMKWDKYRHGKLKKEFSVKQLLNGIERPDQRGTITAAPIKIFLEYSEKDMKYKEEFFTAISYLEKTNEITIWHKGLVIPSENTNKEIFSNLANSKLIVCLVSKDFIASDFFYSKEFDRTFKSHGAVEKVIFPILIKESSWQATKLADLTCSPKKPISSFDSPDRGWKQVFFDLKDVIDKIRSGTI